MEMFWDDAPVQLNTGRDQRIADGLEVAALDAIDDESVPETSDGDIAYYNPQTKESAPGRSKRRKLRVAGGIAPTAKPVTADYDSDDGRIIELKQLGYPDEVVAATLVEEGRIRYVPKTINSRYLRLRKVLDDKEDEKLDDELTDWHEGEDAKLMPIVEAMETKLAKQIESLKLRMWKDISCYFAGKLGGRKKYTHNACRERAEAVIAGKELVPIEADEDQDGRRKMREERIKAAKAAREAARNEAIELEARKQAKTMERKRAIAEANQKRVAFQLNKIAEKKERLRIRDERIANRDSAKMTRLRILNHMRIQRDWEMEKNRWEKQIYKKIMGIDLNGRPSSRPSRREHNTYDSDEESEAIDDFESDEEEINLTDAEDADDADDADDESNDDNNDNIGSELEDPTTFETHNVVESAGRSRVQVPHIVNLPALDRSKRKRKPTKLRYSAGGTESSSTPTSKGQQRPAETAIHSYTTGPSSAPARQTISQTKKKSASALNYGSNAVVTEDTLFSPRSVMTRPELDLICVSRRIPILSATEESHPQLVARLNAIDEGLNRQELDDLLRSATESVQGPKLAKIERLQKSDVSKSLAGGMGIVSNDIDHMRLYEGFTGEFKSLLDDAEHSATRQNRLATAAGSSTALSPFAEW